MPVSNLNCNALMCGFYDEYPNNMRFFMMHSLPGSRNQDSLASPNTGINGGGKLGRVGGSIVRLWRRKTVPSGVLRKVDQQPRRVKCMYQVGLYARVRRACLA